jgi:hypothetical protein
MSTVGYNLKVIIKLIEKWASYHQQINRFSFGTIQEADLGKTDAYCWMHVAPSSVSYSDGTRTISLDIMVADLVKDHDDKMNAELDVINDCAMIMEDLINTIENSEYAVGTVAEIGDNLILQKPVNVTPFYNDFTNNLAGVECTLSFDADYTFDFCESSHLLI